ncbi:hypothetical protein KJ633_07520 [bacterium]|nr:hypothetical protein [bacterium]MBU3956294.1 hypothetical protein [bacterium]
MQVNLPLDLEDKMKTGTISYGAAAALRFLGEKDRAAVCEFLVKLRASSSLMKEFSEHILDISKRDGISAFEILNAENVKKITDMECSRKIKTEKLRQLLRAIRYPALTAKENEMENALKKLALPQNMSLRRPENFEGKKVSLTIRFENTAQLKKAIAEIDTKTALLDKFLELL